MLVDGGLRAGILYAAFAIPQAAAEAYAALHAAGVDCVLDGALAAGEAWGSFPASAVRVTEGAPSVLLRDLNGTIIRLVTVAA